MANQLRAKYDIIINGGGIVGFTLLNLISKSPYLKMAKVLLIEQSMKPMNVKQHPRETKHDNDLGTDTMDNKSFSNRVSSITMSSKQAFKRMGIWDTIEPYAKDVRKIHVWNYDYNHKIEFIQDLAPGCPVDRSDREVVFSTVENNRLSSALLEAVTDDRTTSSSISWSSCLQELNESLEDGLVDVTISKEKSDETMVASAPLVLGCDGYKSKVRDLAKISYKECDLMKTAVVGTVKMTSQITNSDNSIAYQRFSSGKDTVAALLPLDNEFCSFVISAPSDYANFLEGCSDESFTEEFNKLLSEDEQAPNVFLRGTHEIVNATFDNLRSILQLAGPRLGFNGSIIDMGLDEKPTLDYVVENSRATFPLKFGSTSPKMIATLPGLAKSHIALLGDSAHRVHPLAGQGLNLGIQDAIELVKQLEALAKTGERLFLDPSLLEKALRKYEFRRQAFILPMSASILAMQDLFKLAPSRLISSINKCEPVKKFSVRFANG